MRRRALIGSIAGVASWPIAARAQQKPTPAIGYLSGGLADTAGAYRAAFAASLREAGFVEGQTVTVEHRFAEGRFERLPAMAADLVGRKVDVIFTGGTQATRAAKATTSTIPIVFLIGDDPVAEGFVPSLARPLGNLTGISNLLTDLAPKRLQLLRELLPRATRIALLMDPRNPGNQRTLREMQDATQAKGLALHVVDATSEAEIDGAFASLARLQADALFVHGDQFFSARREQIVALAAMHAVPAIYAIRDFTAAGGLISYGPSLVASIRDCGAYAGRILKGARPADLPVVQPTVFELAINLRTARTLGLAIPPALLARADDVIE